MLSFQENENVFLRSIATLLWAISFPRGWQKIEKSGEVMSIRQKYFGTLVVMLGMFRKFLERATLRHPSQLQSDAADFNEVNFKKKTVHKYHRNVSQYLTV